MNWNMGRIYALSVSEWEIGLCHPAVFSEWGVIASFFQQFLIIIKTQSEYYQIEMKKPCNISETIL